MSDSQIPITPGSGLNVDAQNVGGNYRQTITVGSPSSTLAIAPVDATLGMSVYAAQSGAYNVTATIANLISANVSIQGAPAVNASIQGVPGVIASIANFPTSQVIYGSVTIGVPSVSQGTNPWTVQATTFGTLTVVGGGSATDGESSNGSLLSVGFNSFFNNVTWDRARNVVGAVATVGGVGLGAMGIFGQYFATTQTVASVGAKAYFPAQIDLNGNLMTNIVAATTVTLSVGNFPANQVVSGSVTIYGSISAAGVTTVYQGGAPWTVNASIQGVPNINASIQGVPGVIATIANASIPVTQSGSWALNASIVGIQNINASIIGVQNVIATIANTISASATIGTPTVNQGTNPWLVQATVGIPTVNQGTSPWIVNASILGNVVVSGSVTTYSNTGSVTITNVTLAALATVWQGGAPWLVSASIGIPNVLATIIGLQNVIATVVSMPAINASIVGIQNVNASIIGVQNVIATVLQGTNPWLVSATIGVPSVLATLVGTSNVYPLPQTGNGTSTYSAQVTNSIQNIKTTTGLIYGYHMYNNNATVAYVNIYNGLASSLTVATNASLFDVWPVPAQGGATRQLFGKQFNNSIAIAATATRGAGGALAASVDVSVDYF